MIRLLMLLSVEFVTWSSIPINNESPRSPSNYTHPPFRELNPTLTKSVPKNTSTIIYPTLYIDNYSSPPPGIHSRSNFYQQGFEASIPTLVPSPRTPSLGKRRSSQHPGSSGYASGKRQSSARPRPGVQYRGVHFIHTPVHTPPPSSHAHHNLPNYVPGGFTQQQPEYSRTSL